MLSPPRSILLIVIVVVLTAGRSLLAQEYSLSTFTTQELSDEYFSEGASAGDINGDAIADVVCGPYWYQGPDFSRKHQIYEPVPQNRDRYANNFFSWVHDFDGDGKNDVFTVGFPGTPAHLYRNPGTASDGHWRKHEVLDWVSNESPQFTNIVGDERPELVCTRDGFYGFATWDPDKPFAAWTFHPVSTQIANRKFGHGLGVGDIDGDGLNDIIFASGWCQQPAQDATTSRWPMHPQKFSLSYGGADMHAYDVDGDGDNDVITSHAAHDFGLGWYEQYSKDGKPAFRHHLIMGDRPEQNRYGLVFSELHSVNLIDVNGDGLKDIVTGKTYWSHHRQSPMWDAGPVVYWFQLRRTESGVDWVPFKAGDTSGIGRQLTIHDLDGDNAPDMVVGGMKGTYVLKQTRKSVDQAEWNSAQPSVFVPSGERLDRGSDAKFDDNGKIVGAVEGELMDVIDVSGGKTSVQSMSGFTKGQWSGGKQLFWSNATPRSRLRLEFTIQQAGDYELGVVMTTARDYAIVNLQLDGTALGKPLDLYDYPDVKTTGVVSLGTRVLTAGKHKLMLETVGANKSAVKKHMVGLDCLILNKK